tara:strand:- start:1989 stop:2213 length:225 start_codon:yes stop_codon:yes gene_type:complete
MANRTPSTPPSTPPPPQRTRSLAAFKKRERAALLDQNNRHKRFKADPEQAHAVVGGPIIPYIPPATQPTEQTTG